MIVGEQRGSNIWRVIYVTHHPGLGLLAAAQPASNSES